MDAQAFKAAIFKAHNVSSIEELKKTKAWGEATARILREMPQGQTPDAAAVLRAVALVSEEGAVAGFYIGPGTVLKNENGSWTRQNVGPRVLLASGDLKMFNGPQLEGVKPIVTEVAVGPVRVTRDIYRGIETINAIKEKTKVIVQKHGYALPDVGIARHIKRALTPDSETKTKKENQRGVIMGDSGDSPVFATLKISDESADISFFKASGEQRFGKDSRDECHVIARDSIGNAVKIKVHGENLATLRTLYGLSDEADASEYKSMLVGEPIAVNGKLGILHPKRLEDFGEDQPVVVEVLRQLHESQRLREIGKAGDGSPLRALLLADYFVNGANGEPEQALFLKIGRYNVYDIQEQVNKATNKAEWQFSVLATDENKTPWMDVTEHPWKKGDRSGVTNEGAFIVFINRMEGAGKIREGDPFAQLAAEVLADK